MVPSVDWCCTTFISFTMRSATVPFLLGFFAFLFFLHHRPLCTANPCFVGYVIPQSVHSNLKAFSGGRLTMSLSVVSDKCGVSRMCCTFVLGIEIVVQQNLEVLFCCLLCYIFTCYILQHLTC